MKALLAGCAALHAGELAELYTLTLTDGTVLCFTSFDVDLVHDGQTYQAGLFNVERDAITTSVGISVDDIAIRLYASELARVDGVALPLFANNGGLSRARVVIKRARNSGTVNVFDGIVSAISADKVKIELTVSPLTLLLNNQAPAKVFSAHCVHSLFDGGCTKHKADFTHAAHIASGSTRSVLLCDLSQANGYFDLGTVQFTSGINSGTRRAIKSYQTGQLTLSAPLPHPPAPADEFNAVAGCNKTRARCGAVFNNEANFLGFPFMPSPKDSV